MIIQFNFTHRLNTNRNYRSSHSVAGINGMENVLYITQSSKPGDSPSDGLVSYPGH